MGEAFRGAYEYIMVYNLSNLNLQSGKCGLNIHATVKTGLPSSEANIFDAGLSALTSASSYVSTFDTIVVSLIDGDRCVEMIEQTVGKTHVLVTSEETGLVFEIWCDSDGNLITESIIVGADDDTVFTVRWCPGLGG